MRACAARVGLGVAAMVMVAGMARAEAAADAESEAEPEAEAEVEAEAEAEAEAETATETETKAATATEPEPETETEAETETATATATATATETATATDRNLLRVDGELAASYRYTARAGADLRELRLDRAELGARVRLSRPAAPLGLALEVRAEFVRSAGAQSVFGIDGDSLLLRARRAQLLGAWRPRPSTFVTAAGGLVGDPWIDVVSTHGQLRAWTSSASERLAGWEPSDVGLRLGAARGPLALDVAATTGEGRRYPERNDGTNLTVVAQAQHARGPARGALALVARDGSLGPGAARDRRLGASVGAGAGWLHGRAEVVRMLGLGGDGALTGWAWQAAISAQPHRWLAASARAAGTRTDGAGSTLDVGGALGASPPTRAGVRLDVMLVVDRSTARGAPLPGTDAASATRLMLVLAARTDEL